MLGALRRFARHRAGFLFRAAGTRDLKTQRRATGRHHPNAKSEGQERLFKLTALAADPPYSGGHHASAFTSSQSCNHRE
jgi:hypothetical protein